MARLIAPNGALVDASEADEPVLLAAGYARAEAKPKAAPRKRAARPKPKTKEE